MEKERITKKALAPHGKTIAKGVDKDLLTIAMLGLFRSVFNSVNLIVIGQIERV